MKENARWGFGFAPLNEDTIYRYNKALSQTSDFVLGKDPADGISITDEISTAKGLYNRILRQDQWDWFTVNMYLDYPPTCEMKKIVNSLILLRSSVIDGSKERLRRAKSGLLNTNFCTYAANFVGFGAAHGGSGGQAAQGGSGGQAAHGGSAGKAAQDGPGGQAAHGGSAGQYICILSRRIDGDLLYIGVSVRNPAKLAQEANSSDGVRYLFSPRKAVRVTDGSSAKSLIFERLSGYALKGYGGFFMIPYAQACGIIEECLSENQLYYYRYQ